MPEDIDSLLLFVPQILSETSILPVSHEKIERLIERCANREYGSVAGIIDGEDGGIDGSVGLAFSESDTSDVPFLRAVWIGLHPTVRAPDPVSRVGINMGSADIPRAHYGRALFDFARWCHAGLERIAGHPILLQFDITTRTTLGAKMRLFQRNLSQVGASFAFDTTTDFTAQKIGEADEIIVEPGSRPQRWHRKPRTETAAV